MLQGSSPGPPSGGHQGGDLDVTRQWRTLHGTPGADDGIDRAGLLPLGQEPQPLLHEARTSSLGAHERGDRSRVRWAMELTRGRHGAPVVVGLGAARPEGLGQCEGGRRDRDLVDRSCGLGPHGGIRVLKSANELGRLATAERHHRTAADIRGVALEQAEQLPIGRCLQRVDGFAPEPGVLGGPLLDHRLDPLEHLGREARLGRHRERSQGRRTLAPRVREEGALDEGRGRPLAEFAEGAQGLDPHLGISVLEERDEGAADAADERPLSGNGLGTPDAVEPTERMLGGLAGHLQEEPDALAQHLAPRRRSQGPRHQLQLGLLTHIEGRVEEQPLQLPWLSSAHPLAQERLDLPDRGVVAMAFRLQLEHAPLAGHPPAADPVAHVELAVRTEVTVRREEVPHERLGLDEGEPGPLGLVADPHDRGPLRSPPEVAQEEGAGELTPPLIGHASEPRRPRADIGDGRRQEPGLVLVIGLPLPLRVPGPPGVGPVHVLVVVPPPRVATRDDVDPARLVPTVGVVVPGEEITALVEGELLGVPQTRGVELEVRAVQLAPQHGAPVRELEVLPLRPNVQPAVPDGEVQPAIEADPEPVHVVPEEGDLDAEAPVDRLPRIGDAVPVDVLQAPEVGDAGEPDLFPPDEEAGADPLRGALEPIRVDGGRIARPVLVRVHEEPDPVVLPLVRSEAIPCPTAHVGDTVLDGARRELVLQPVHVGPHVGDPRVDPEGLRDPDAAVVVDIEADRIGEVGLLGPEVSRPALRHADPLQGLAPLVRGLVHAGGVAVGAGGADLVLRGGRDGGGDKEAEGRLHAPSLPGRTQGLPSDPTRPIVAQDEAHDSGIALDTSRVPRRPQVQVVGGPRETGSRGPSLPPPGSHLGLQAQQFP